MNYTRLKEQFLIGGSMTSSSPSSRLTSTQLPHLHWKVILKINCTQSVWKHNTHSILKDYTRNNTITQVHYFSNKSSPFQKMHPKLKKTTCYIKLKQPNILQSETKYNDQIKSAKRLDQTLYSLPCIFSSSIPTLSAKSWRLHFHHSNTPWPWKYWKEYMWFVWLELSNSDRLMNKKMYFIFNNYCNHLNVPY